MFLCVANLNKYIFKGNIKKISVTGIEGMLNIYPGHAPLLTLIKPGCLNIVSENTSNLYFYISNGILEVQPNNINILSEVIIHGNNLNYSKIIAQKENIITDMQCCNSDSKKKILKDKLYKTIKKIQVFEIMKKNCIY